MAEYSAVVWAHFQTPRNVGSLAGTDVIEGWAGNRRAGPFFHLTARVRHGVLEELAFETFGCPAAIAAGSVLTEALRGKATDFVSKWNIDSLVAVLGGLPREKYYCAELAVQSLRLLEEKLP